MPNTLPSSVRIVEVGPRDGLQNEPAVVSTADKVRFVDMLSASGVTDIEVSSFVNPRKVPQLADAEDVFANMSRGNGVRYWALVPNRRGLDRALAASVDSIALFTAASETFCVRNIGMSIAESLDEFKLLAVSAKATGLRTRGYVSTAFYCPYEGRIDPQNTAGVASALLDLGVDEVSIGDTVGRANPAETDELTSLLTAAIPVDRLAYHFHDTNGLALANIEAALRHGVATYDASASGLGGCPFAPGSTGNVSTERVLGLMDSLGIATGVDIDAVRNAGAVMRGILDGNNQFGIGIPR